MKTDGFKHQLMKDELNKIPPIDMEGKVQKKISDFKLLHDLFKHFTTVPMYLININEIEGEENE